MAPTVEDIVDILGKMQVEDAKNNDVLKAVFSDFKKAIESKHNLTLKKFEEVEEAFKKLDKKQQKFSKTEELKDLFEVFQKHVVVVSDDIKEQKNVLAKLENTIFDIFDKQVDKDYFKQFAEQVKDSIVSIVENQTAYDEFARECVNDIQGQLDAIVTKEDNVELKADVRELIQKANNTIDALRFFNDKSENLANVIRDLIVSEESIRSQGNIDEILEKSRNISEQLSNVSTHSDIESVSSKIEDLSEDYNARMNEVSDRLGYLPFRTDIEDVSSKIEDLSRLYNTRIEEITSTLKECISNTALIASSGNDDLKETLLEKFSVLQTSVAAVSHSFDDDMRELQGKLMEFVGVLTSGNDENSKNISMSLTEMADIKNELTSISSILYNVTPQVESKIVENAEFINTNIASLVSEIDMVKVGVQNSIKTQALQASLDSISYRFDEIVASVDKYREVTEEKNADLMSDISEKINGLRQEAEFVNTDLLNSISKRNDDIENKISELKIDITNLLAFDFSKDFDELKMQIEMSFLNVGTDLTNRFAENKEAIEKVEVLYKSFQEQISELDAVIKDEIKNGLELLKIAVESFGKNVETHLAKMSNFIDDWEKQTEDARCFVEGVKTSIETKLDDCCVDLKSYVDDNCTERTIKELANLKTSLVKNFEGIVLSQENFKNDVNSNFKAVLDKQDDKTKDVEIIRTEVNNLGQTLRDFVTDACENSMSRVDETIKNISTIGTMVDDNEEIVSVIDNIKKVLSQEIVEKLNSYTSEQDEKFNKLQADINSYLYTEQIDAEKTKILDEIFKIKAHSENNQQIMNILDVLEKRINSIDAKNPVNDYVKSLSEINKKAVLTELSNIKEELEFCIAQTQGSLNEVSDSIFAIEEDTKDISEKITGISDSFVGVNENINKIDTKIEHLSESGTNLAKTLEALHSKVDILALNDTDDFDIESEIEDIKDLIVNQIEDLKTSKTNSNNTKIDECLNKLLEDINTIKKDSTDSSTKDSIISAIVSIMDQISFVEETEEIKDFVEEKTDEINEKLKEVHEQLQLISSADNSEYTYTMQDVESDIAKLRLAMNEVTNSAPQQTLIELRDNIERVVSSVEQMQTSLTEDQIVDLKNDFVKLSEDMVSISSRTNKLLLTSDESYKALSDGLDRFGGLIYQLEEKIHFPDTTEIDERIEQKVDALSVAVNNSVANDQIFHQVLQYLGEWMDSVSESINSISEKTSSISGIKEITEELKFALPQKSELIEELEHRFEAQELRIDRLEMKLDNILLAVEEKPESIVSKKLDKLEKQLAKLSINVDKLASYVDEE